MQNVREAQKKTCIFLEIEEFNSIIHRLFGDNIETDFSLDGVYVGYENGDNLDTQEMHNKLAEYFDVATVTSIHIDDADVTGVWVVYKDEKPEPEYHEDDEVLLTSDTLAQFLGEIVDIFEDYCELHNIDIPNDDRDAAIEDFREDYPEEAEDMSDDDIIKDQGLARIYGSDYDNITGDVEIECLPILDEGKTVYFSEQKTRELAAITVNNFRDLIDFNSEYVEKFDEDEKWFVERLIELFFNWNVAGKTFYATFRVDGRFTTRVKAFDDENGDYEDVEHRAIPKYEEADFGELECVDSDFVRVDDADGNILKD